MIFKSLFTGRDYAVLPFSIYIATALCLFTLHFQTVAFLRRLDELPSREISLVPLVSSLREKEPWLKTQGE